MRPRKSIAFVIAAILLSYTLIHADAIDDRIAKINKAIKEHGYNWVAGRNEISVLPDEVKRGLCGLKISKPSPNDKFFAPDVKGKQFPAYLDWRNENGMSFVTPIRNQYACGACWAFATVGAFESTIAVKEPVPNPDFDLSEQMLLSCTSAGNCSYGGYLNAAADALVSIGTTFEECLPYEASDQVPCSERCEDWPLQIVTAKSWSWVGKAQPDVDTMKAALMIAPVAAGLIVYEDFFDYEGGVYQRTPGSPMKGLHAVLLIGWDDAQQCWIAKNSWGTTWGEDGFFKIKWGAAYIGASSILFDYAPGNFHPPQDDDTADDDATDDDSDSNKDSGGGGGCGF